MKLISMTDFVLEQIELNNKEINDDTRTLDIIDNYAKFLKTPLNLGMFIPCDENNKPLNEPSCMYIYQTQIFECTADEMYRCRKYLEAKEKVIFKGFWLDETYKREKTQLPYLTNGKISVFLHSDFAIRHQLIKDLVDSDLECAVSF
jgi:hypothetical protein